MSKIIPINKKASKNKISTYVQSLRVNSKSLNQRLKQQLLSASSSALRICENSYDKMISFERLDKINIRATPMKMMYHKHAILLKLYNNKDMSDSWIDLNFQQSLNDRNNFVTIFDGSKLKVGRNLQVSRLNLISNRIDSKWLNMSFETYQIRCKELFFKWQIKVNQEKWLTVT